MSNAHHVCHITTIHPSKDVRIFHKECTSLAKAGYRVTLLVGNGDDEICNDVAIKGVKVDYSGRVQRFLKAGKAMYLPALKEQADIYQFHDPDFLPFALKLQKKTGAKLVYDSHEDVPRQLLDKHYLPKWLSKMASGFVESYEDSVVRKLNAVVTADDKVTVRFSRINDKVVCVKNYADLESLPAPIPFGKKKNQICHIGSLTKVRGVVELVEAMDKVDCELHLAGTFSPLELQDEVSQLPGWKKVVYHGFANREKVTEILDDSLVGTVTLHPIDKYLDALPVKMFEYMAAGIPAITSTVPLWKGIVEDASCGVAVDPKKADEIAEAVNKLLSDPIKAEEMGASGRESVEKKYNWKSESATLLELYNDILK
jgi:glycosyltransferase involved in cell wall biosynthesis